MGGLLFALMLCYLIGSVPTAFLLIRWLKRVDIRTVGSGNIGATNAARAAGVWAGGAVFLLDVLKGLVGVWLIAPALVSDLGPGARLSCGLAAVIGHSFPVFLRFQGGKGVATTMGVLLGTMPAIALICLVAWGLVFAILRYVSVGSLAFALLIPFLQLATHQSLPQVLSGAALALLIVGRHRSNIERLLRGSEHRVSLRRG